MSSWRVLCRETIPLSGSSLQRTSQPVMVSISAWHHVNRQRPEQQPFEPLLSHCLPAAVAAVLTLSHLVSPQPVLAADTVKVGTCLLQKCQLQLAECLGDPVCLQDIVCLNLCNTAKDEAACQIRCGDLYSDQATDTFNACAVSQQKCVPQKQDEGLYPVPPDCALDNTWDFNGFTGRWFITAGQNPLFDIFDCQEHFFAMPEPGRLAAKINWRINKPNGDFIERSTIQMFNQDPDRPAVLYNHDNEYLHYQDDWYIIASKPDSYAVVYYKGSNDAWDGYGGAVVYTRERQLPQELIPELSAAVEKVGMKWSDFTVTDNTCSPHPPMKTLVEDVEEEVVVLEKDLERGLKSFGRGFTVLARELEGLEEKVEKELSTEEKLLQKELQMDFEKAKRLLEQVEREVVEEEKAVQGGLGLVIQNLARALQLR